MAVWMQLRQEPPINVPGGHYPLFNRISIETTSYCNRKCSFCPLSWGDRGRNVMNPMLFNRLVGELGSLGFDGSIHPFLINEPTINPNILPELRALRAACPKATISIATNFDVLDRWFQKEEKLGLEKVQEFFTAGLNIFSVNVYDDQAQLDRYWKWIELITTRKLAEYTHNRWRRHPPKKQFIALTDMRLDRGKNSLVDTFYTRSKEERIHKEPLKAYCAETQRQIVVRWDGKVPICCATDPTDESMMIGDVANSTLVDVWNSDPFMMYRYYTQQKERVLPGCNTCTFKMAYPHVVRLVKPDQPTELRWQGSVRKR